MIERKTWIDYYSSTYAGKALMLQSHSMYWSRQINLNEKFKENLRILELLRSGWTKSYQILTWDRRIDYNVTLEATASKYFDGPNSSKIEVEYGWKFVTSPVCSVRGRQGEDRVASRRSFRACSVATTLHPLPPHSRPRVRNIRTQHPTSPPCCASQVRARHHSAETRVAANLLTNMSLYMCIISVKNLADKLWWYNVPASASEKGTSAVDRREIRARSTV